MGYRKNKAEAMKSDRKVRQALIKKEKEAVEMLEKDNDIDKLTDAYLKKLLEWNKVPTEIWGT